MKKALITGIAEQDKRLLEFLSSQEYIKLAYLFGSAAEGKEGKLSDVDIAILFDDLVNKKENLIYD